MLNKKYRRVADDEKFNRLDRYNAKCYDGRLKIKQARAEAE
jgi:hypothetical protein